MAESAEEKRAALVDRVAKAWTAEFGGCFDGPAVEWASLPGVGKRARLTAAEAVVTLLESGEAGVWLVPEDGIQGAAGVVVGQLRAALASAQADVEDFRQRLGTVLDQRDEARGQVAELLPYADAGAEALEMWEPYGPSSVSRGEPAGAMLSRIRSGEFGEVPS